MMSIRRELVRRWAWAMGLVALLACPTSAADPAAEAASKQAANQIDFRAEVAPILSARCLGCHNAKDHKGGFSLATAEGLAAGAESGPVISRESLQASLFLEVISGDKPRMPLRGNPLTEAERAILTRWIESGANWPDGVELKAAESSPQEAWWSLRPLAKPEVPVTKPMTKGIPPSGHPIDRFISAKLAEQGLSPSPRADRRVLIRRVWFDLVGLPPDPEAVDRFVQDPADDDTAWRKLVDQLMESPHYGERWARHWLDLVHYGDTHGFDKDKVRPNAWPYRDYVIRSLNADIPYSRFVEQQLAGDVLSPNTADGIIALGFLASGPWDFVGQVELREGTIDKQITRNLDRDDFVATTLNTFCALTVQCARCHDHKFDPVSQSDYYALQAVFAAIDRADRPYDADPETPRLRQMLEAERSKWAAQRQALEAHLPGNDHPELASLGQKIEAVVEKGRQPVRPAFGYHSGIEANAETAKWVLLDFGKPIEIGQVLYVACHDDFNGIGAGFGFPRRYRIETSDDAGFRTGVAVLRDASQADVENPGVAPQVVSGEGRTARYLRFTATRLAPRSNDFIFALGEIAVLTPSGENVAPKAKVTSLDSIEALPRWSKANLVDGYYFGGGDPANWSELAPLVRARDELRERLIAPAIRRELAQVADGERDVKQRLDALPKPTFVFAATTDFPASGGFLPTKGQPRPIHRLQRGSEKAPRELVGPAAPGCVGGLEGTLPVPSGATEGEVRAALARWIVDPKNSLTWRTIVNRVWQSHFGRGLVDTPNDFGRMGALPTHPELLDWLAVSFRDGAAEDTEGLGFELKPQSLKSLHRLILTSATYCQVSTHKPDQAALDGANQFLWRMNRQRLDAESIRDAVLVVSGRWDPTMYGPPFRPFGFKDDHSPHYLYDEHDPDTPASLRRSIYRFLVRSVPEPFMETLDCADPSQLVPKRNETLTALQALALLNNRFVLRMSDHFAERLQHVSVDPREQLRLALRLAIAREPTEAELNLLVEFAREKGLPQACRLIFNLNEFAFVD
jgi:hypothetical protein